MTIQTRELGGRARRARPSGVRPGDARTGARPDGARRAGIPVRDRGDVVVQLYPSSVPGYPVSQSQSSVPGGEVAGRSVSNGTVPGSTVPGRTISGGQAPLRLTRRGRWVLTLLVTMVVVGLGLMGSRAEADSPARGVEVVSYTVQPGDTLWELASDLAVPGADVRDVIVELQELNGLPRAELTAGQRLVLPVDV